MVDESLTCIFRVCHENFQRLPTMDTTCILADLPGKCDNSESRKIYGIAKILIVPKSLEETRQTWTLFSKLKALVDSEQFRGIVFLVQKR